MRDEIDTGDRWKCPICDKLVMLIHTEPTEGKGKPGHRVRVIRPDNTQKIRGNQKSLEEFQ